MKLSLPFNINRNYFFIALLLLSVYPGIMYFGRQLPINSIIKVIPTATPEPSPTPKEFVMDDNSYNSVTQNSLTLKEVPKDVVLNADDGSQIRTSYDAYGNKTEVRMFFNDPKLKQIMMRTSADGQKQVYVYGQNGEVETLPGAMVERVLTGSANEIANSAGITKTRQEKVKMVSSLYVPLAPVEQNNAQQNLPQIPNPNAARETVQEETRASVEESAKTDAVTAATPVLNPDARKSMTDSLRKP